jgi:L-tyrosine isonitrile synthase
MPEYDLLLAGAPARYEHSRAQGPLREEGALRPGRESRGATPRPAHKPPHRKHAARKKPSADEILRSFNSWAFKREQPGNPHLLLRCIERAVALSQPVSFVLYWGKGPRCILAAADMECLDFIKKLRDRVAMVHEPGVAITLICTDTHARLNGHSEAAIQRYFGAIDRAARERGFSTCRLSELVAEHCPAAHKASAESAEGATLAALMASAQKWYRGVGSAEDGAREYYRMNMQEKRAVERAFPGSIFITFNGSILRALFPEHLPIFYMYSLRRGTSVKPWFMPDEALASVRACPA